MDRDNLYYVEIAAEGNPPGFNKQSWKGFDEASSYELRLWSYDKRRERITLVQVEKGK